MSDFDKENWHGSSVETPTTPLIDEGKGEKFVLRHFEYRMNPEIIGKNITKQELFDAHARQMRDSLWEDGLVPVKEADPRIVVQGDIYRIFITCRPRINLGVQTSVNEEAQTLQDIFKPENLT